MKACETGGCPFSLMNSGVLIKNQEAHCCCSAHAPGAGQPALRLEPFHMFKQPLGVLPSNLQWHVHGCLMGTMKRSGQLRPTPKTTSS